MCGASWCGSPCGVAEAVWLGAAVGVLPWPISLAIEFGSKLRDGLGFSGLLRPLGRRIDELWPHRRLNRRFLDGGLRRRRRWLLGSFGRHRFGVRRRRRIRFLWRRGFRRRVLGFWRRGRGLRGLRFGRRGRRRLWRGRRRGRGLWRGFGVLFAVGDLIEFAQRNGFNRDRFGSVCESRSRGEAEHEQRQQRPVQRCGARKIRI